MSMRHVLHSFKYTIYSRPSRSIHIRRVGFATITTLHQAPVVTVLRPYQQECVDAVLNDVATGKKRLGVSLATGGGKTVIFTQLIEKIQPPTATATQTLIIAHRRELIEQAARHCQKAYPDKTISIELANSHASGFEDIIIASVKSLNSNDRLTKFNPNRFKLIVVDEAHHIVAKSYLNVLEHFGLKNEPTVTNVPVLVGFSATFSRFDGLKIGAAIDYISFHKDNIEMINQKWLCELLFTTVRFKNADLTKVKTSDDGDFSAIALSKVLNTDKNNESIFEAWSTHCANRKSTLIFTVDISHAEAVAACFKENGIYAKAVSSKTKNAERAQIIDDFKTGKFPVLINCGIFTEGTDIPNIDCVVLARPTRSVGLLYQMIGRGMRLSPGKDNCHVIDMVAALSKTGLVTTPVLFGMDPNEIIDSLTSDELINMQATKTKNFEKQEVNHQYPGEMSFKHYNSISELLENTSIDKQIRQCSVFAWVKVGNHDYILSHLTKGFLRLRKESEAYILTYTRRIPKSGSVQFARPQTLFDFESTFEHAVHASDSYVKNLLSPAKLLHIHASWRASPASDSQLAFLNKIKTDGSKLTSSGTTKGYATDMITKFRFGARAQFQKMERIQSQKQKIAQQQANLDKRRAPITVGPIRS